MYEIPTVSPTPPSAPSNGTRSHARLSTKGKLAGQKAVHPALVHNQQDDVRLRCADQEADGDPVEAGHGVLRQFPGARIAPRLALSGLASNGHVSTIFLADGVAPADMKALRGPRSGSGTLSADAPEGIAMASGLAALLGLKEGDDASLLVSTVHGQANAADATVIDRYSTGNAGLEDKAVFVPLAMAQSLYDASGRADHLTVLLPSITQPAAARAALAPALAAAGLDVEIKTWRELSAFYRQVKGMFDMIFAFILAIVLFGYAAGRLGPLPWKLVPLALLIILGYSFCKRFTALSHVVLGLSLAGAPLGAWIAVNGRLDPPAWFLAAGVLAWTAGFDILYSLQDLDFDQDRRLHSIPARLGVPAALWISRALHLAALASWAAFNLKVDAHLFPWLAWAAVAAILGREQWVVRGGRLDRIDHAFFTLNSLVGLIFFAGHVAEWTVARLLS